MNDLSVTIRLSQSERKKLEQLSESTGLSKSQLIRDLIAQEELRPMVDRSREIMPHLCSILTAVERLYLPEADAVRKEVNSICRCLNS